MKVKFTDKFYSNKLIGKSKVLPDHIAKALIESGEATEVKTRKTKKTE